jgi:hypothetical protein
VLPFLCLIIIIIKINKKHHFTKLNERKKYLFKLCIFEDFSYIYCRIKYNAMARYQKTINGERHFYIDDVEVNSYQFQCDWAQERGFKNAINYYQSLGKFQPKRPEVVNKFKPQYQELPDNAFAVPNLPNYYATPNGEIWGWSDRRKCYLHITQQTQRTNYNVVQVFINQKKYIRYVHHLVNNTFNTICPAGHEIHHRDNDKQNNNASNLMCVPKDEHRRMKRKPYKKNK